MEKDELITEVSKKMRLIRAEAVFSQEKMASILGISKKTLVQIEKGRIEANWSIVVSVTALFDQSEILQTVLGEDPLEVVRLVAFEKIERPTDKTMGGRVWWREIANQGNYRVQQNVISQHYRIIDELNFRWFSSFDLEEVMNHLEELNL